MSYESKAMSDRAAPESEADDIAGRHFWLVMIPQRFEDMQASIGGMVWKMAAPVEEPFAFIPIFTTYEEAVRWNDGSAEHIVEARQAPIHEEAPLG